MLNFYLIHIDRVLNKFMRIVLLVFCTLNMMKLVAQYNTDFLNYSNTGRFVGTGLEFDAGSNGMSNKLTNKLIWGGYISNDLKNESSRHLQARNNFGVSLNYNVSAIVKGKKSFDFLIAFKEQEVVNSTFSEDFFNLLFYGNSMYKGRYADVSHCNVNALRFQEVKFGTILHHVDSNARIGVAVSVLKGEQFYHIQTLDNSSLYTSPDGTELILNSNFEMAVSDTANRGLRGFNGLGASAEIFFETMYKTRFGKNCMLSVTANNLGFIHWWNNSVQYSSDSTIKYQGYTVKSITDLQDSALNRIDGDSLLKSLAHARTGEFNVNIPTNLVIINRIYFNAKISAATGFRYVFNANYRPYFFVEPEYKVKQMAFSLHVGYGGYTNMNIGAAMTWNGKGWFMKLGSNSIQGYLAPKTAYSQGVYISIAKKLK